VGGPIVDQLNAVHPEPNAIIGCGVKSISLGEERLNLASPSHGKSVGTDRWIRRTGAPVEIHSRIHTRQNEAGEIHVVVIITLQAEQIGTAETLAESVLCPSEFTARTT